MSLLGRREDNVDGFIKTWKWRSTRWGGGRGEGGGILLGTQYSMGLLDVGMIQRVIK